MSSRERGRSRSPNARPTSPSHRKRSHSRDVPLPNRKKNSGGFKWKNKPSQDSHIDRENERRNNKHDDSYRPRRYRDDRGQDRHQSHHDRQHHDRVTVPRNADARSDGRTTWRVDSRDKSNQARSDVPPASQVSARAATFIIVTVNDRLGTKASIPCLPSDTVGDFKKLVAAHIGRQPHEIQLKRQGERPFKDIITLQDYGISNGVQLDLELDTGE